MTQKDFDAAVVTFDQREPFRAKLYYRARGLIDAGFPVEAHLLILATWNFARFRYVTKTFDLEAYGGTLACVSKLLRSLDCRDLVSTDLAEHREQIIQSFDHLAAIEGIKFTGAAKILHLMYPQFFVMWDRFISGQYPKIQYLGLEINQSGFWPYRKFRCSGTGYFDFLQFCQKRFERFVSPDERKSLAKCLDEFNFCMLTSPLAQALKKPVDPD